MKAKKVSKKSQSTASASEHGGARKGAGRPPSDNPKKLRSLKVRDEDWDKVLARGGKEGLSVGDLLVYLVTGKAPID